MTCFGCRRFQAPFFKKNIKVKGRQCTDYYNQLDDVMQDKLSNLVTSFRKGHSAQQTLLMNAGVILMYLSKIRSSRLQMSLKISDL